MPLAVCRIEIAMVVFSNQKFVYMFCTVPIIRET
jgi:hypothetical protein